MSAEKSRPRCTGTGEAITNRKEKRMPLHLTPDTVGEAIARIEDLLEFHGGTPMWRYMWNHTIDAVLFTHIVSTPLPVGLSHPEAVYGPHSQLWHVTVAETDFAVALVTLGDKVAEAVNFKVAS